jgi:hypothetical protein
MTCQNESIREALPEYLASRLPPDHAQKIKEHLEVCDECRLDLTLMKQLTEETVPEPPVEFWSSLPGKVTSSVSDPKQRSYRLPFPSWAGGLAAAALVILLIISPWKESRMDVQIPGEYYAQMSGRFGLGLEEEILTVSGLQAVDLDRSLERYISLSDGSYSVDSPNDMYQPGLFEGMNNKTLEAFEKLIDGMSPMS